MRKPLDPAVEQALDKLKNRLGQLLLKILEEKKLENRKFNQNNLAEMLDFGSSEISEYLDCKRVPTLSKLLKLAMFREQNIESLIAELLGRSIDRTSQSSVPIEDQIRSLDTTAKFKLMQYLVLQLSGASPEVMDSTRKITPSMVDMLSLEETIEVMELLMERQRTLLKKFSAKKESR